MGLNHAKSYVGEGGGGAGVKLGGASCLLQPWPLHVLHASMCLRVLLPLVTLLQGRNGSWFYSTCVCLQEVTESEYSIVEVQPTVLQNGVSRNAVYQDDSNQRQHNLFAGQAVNSECAKL